MVGFSIPTSEAAFTTPSIGTPRAMFLNKHSQAACLLVGSLLWVQVSTTSAKYCKPIPDSDRWPTTATWQALNNTVAGRLVAPVPPGAVCHPDQPEFNNATCQEVALQWTNSSFHALDPVSVDYNDETCPPNATMPCSARGYPAYVIEAVDAKDVQSGVKFAGQTGVRLVVKGTGHDFPGRSSGAGSLSIHTHKIRGITMSLEDPRAVRFGGTGSVRIAAGERMGDVYRFAANNNITIVGGADPGVGIGGWVSGGGHGPITAHYGLGADQVLEMDVVTPDGKLRTINEECGEDLFWAMRGGGGSTFGVIISVTVKAYPPLAISEWTFAYNTTGNSDTFWSMNAYFHSQLPRLSDSGLMGYYTSTPLDITEQNATIAGKIVGTFLAPQLTADQIAAIVTPMEKEIVSRKWGDPILIDSLPAEYPDFTKMWLDSTPQFVGYSARLSSRLLDEAALTSPSAKAAFQNATPPPWNMGGYFISGPGVHYPFGGIPGGDNAVLPGWRKAITHVVLPRIWTPGNETQKTLVTTDLREHATQNLRDLAPDTGAYRNEADPTEPNWQKTFHGDHYPRLLKIKNHYDPNGVFWCKACVGSEQWEVMGWNGEAKDGVGQAQIKLCRK